MYNDLYLYDKRRHKEVHIRVVRRGDLPGPKPVIFVLHGIYSDLDGLNYLSELIANEGFTVINVNLTRLSRAIMAPPPVEEDNSKQKNGKLGNNKDKTSQPADSPLSLPQPISVDLQKLPLDRLLITPAYYQDAIDDIFLVIDQLTQHQTLFPKLENSLDMNRIGVIGYSYGGWLASYLSGQARPIGLIAESQLPRLFDSRVKTLVLLGAPVLQQSPTLKKEFGLVERNTLNIFGRFETSPVLKDRHDLFKAFKGYSQFQDHWHLLLKKAQHSTYAGTHIEDPEEMQTFRRTIYAILAFERTYLKNDPFTQNWLLHGGLTHYLQPVGQMHLKGPTCQTLVQNNPLCFPLKYRASMFDYTPTWTNLSQNTSKESTEAVAHPGKQTTGAHSENR